MEQQAEDQNLVVDNIGHCNISEDNILGESNYGDLLGDDFPNDDLGNLRANTVDDGRRSSQL